MSLALTVTVIEPFQALLLEPISDSTTTLRRDLEMEIVSGLGGGSEGQKGTQ